MTKVLHTEVIPAHRPWYHEWEGAVCSFCPSPIQKWLLKCSFLHSVPHPAPYLSPPHPSPCTPASFFCWWASFLCPWEDAGAPCWGLGDTPTTWHLPFPPSASPPGAPGSMLAWFDRGVTTVRTSSALRLHGWEQVGRGQTPRWVPTLHQHIWGLQLASGGRSLPCPQTEGALLFRDNFFGGEMARNEGSKRNTCEAQSRR